MKTRGAKYPAKGVANVWATEGGFTGLGFLLIFAALCLLTLMGVPFYNHAHAQAERLSAIQDLEMICAKIAAFRHEHDEYPQSLTQIGLDYMRDPWGAPYVYAPRKGLTEQSQTQEAIRVDHNRVPINSDFDLYSNGANGRSTAQLKHRLSADDIVRGRNGAFLDLAKRF